MISVKDLSMRFGQQVLFENVSIKFRPGNRYGLIGANGSGKSTFMKILTGQQEATSGDVSIDKGCTQAYLKQDHFQYDDILILDAVIMGNERLWKLHQEREELYSKTDLTDEEALRVGDIEAEFGEAGGYTMEADAAKLLVGLGIEEGQHFEKMKTLTGGFKLRVLLAQVLFASPDILLLDEPTNHLDMASIDWLVDFLKKHQGTIIIISHDRHFLNTVCTNIADLDYHQIREFTGNYDDFMTANAIIMEQMQRENSRKEKRIAELEGFINRFSANASKAKQATSRQKELEKIQLDKMKPSSRVSPFIRFTPRIKLGDKIIEGRKLAKHYDDLTLFENFNLEIGPKEKVAIIGTNGAGKTTLLKMLIKKILSDGGKVTHGETVNISYFPQDSLEIIQGGQPAIDWLAQFAQQPEEMVEKNLRSFMGKMLFSRDEVFKAVDVLSGGERARMILAKMMLEGGNILALDEPTNHLDLEAIEALNYALSLFENTIIFVSHDREFVNSLATRIIEIHDGQIRDYPGTLKEYDRVKERELAKA